MGTISLLFQSIHWIELVVYFLFGVCVLHFINVDKYGPQTVAVSQARALWMIAATMLLTVLVK